MSEGRAITAKTPLGEGKLDFASMAGQDAVSECFEYFVTFATDDFDIDANDMLGKSVTVTVSGNGQNRYFNGLVDLFILTEYQDERLQYVAVLRPWLWFLSKTTDNRIFQDMSVVDIVEEVFSAHPGATFEKRLQSSYQPREYCVQYGESDLNFVQRLLEHEGIFYFFEHDDGEHRMILVDTVAKLQPIPGYETLDYRADSDSGRDFDEAILQWQRTATAVSGSYTQTDYHFEKPSADLSVRSETPFQHRMAEGKLYHYPGIYAEVDRGEDLAAVRLEEVQAPHQRAQAISSAIAPWSGALFKLQHYPREAENDEFVILAASYQMSDGQYSAGGRGNTGFSATYTLAPSAIEYRPPRRAIVPIMKGLQTAVVVGPAGEEIYTDEYSRVKVQFHWDRLGEKNERSTCFIRVSSVWAGSGWGFIQIPRIGQEVIVDFLEGDPDRPIITGRVYNANQMPPYDLPDNMTQSGWKSNSTPGGGGWNEMRFEDKKGEEEVYFQAEKDHNELIKNNESRTIGNDFLEEVGNDATQNIGHDRIETVVNNKSTEVGVNRTVAIGSNDTETVGVDRSLTVGSNETIAVGVNSSETVGSHHVQQVGATQTLAVGGARTRIVGAAEAVAVAAAQSINVGAVRSVVVAATQNHAIGENDIWTVASDYTMTVGSNSSTAVANEMSVNVGTDLSIVAGDQISLVCGKASVVLKKDGTITIRGKDITIEGSGKINAKASGDITMKGSNIKQN